MNPNLIYFPVLAMIILTFAVLIRMFLMRVKGVKEGTVEFNYFKTYDATTTLPTHMVQATRNFTNLFEVPTLFYIVCSFALITKQVDQVMLSLSWAYVALRVLHSFIHLTINKIKPRMTTYALSWIVLLVMSVRLGFLLV